MPDHRRLEVWKRSRPGWRAVVGAALALLLSEAAFAARAPVIGGGTSPTARGSQPAAQPAVRDLLGQAITQFERNQVVESARTFDRLAEAAPHLMPNLWQRGIAQYYAGRYRDCRLQFEAHRTVNPDDVENAAWHFLCAARESTPEKARGALLPVGPDARVPMRQVYELFAGRLTPDAVLAAGKGSASGQFYAHLYLALYFEAMGDARRSLEHITLAAEDRFAEPGDYMHLVARIHLQQRRSQRP